MKLIKKFKKIINHCYDRAKQILTDKREQLELIAQTLLKVETLDAKQIKSLFEDGVLPEPELAKYDSDSDDANMKVNIQSKDEDVESYEEIKRKSDSKLKKGD